MSEIRWGLVYTQCANSERDMSWRSFIMSLHVLTFEHGFFQFGWNDNDLRKLFELDMDSTKFNLSDVYSLQFSNHVIANFRKYFRDKTWLFKSSSAGATAIRMSLPADFNTTDLDGKVCRSSSV